tara:strand:+ start:653 stop:1099 length:447 start_codon:yes stop_codon:yes gene_type:complete
MKLYFAPIFLLFIILNCTKKTGVIPEDELNLQEQEKKWKKQGIIDYEFTSQISCFCQSDYTLPKAISVKNDEIQSINGVAYANLEYENHMTIDELFDYIEDHQNKNPVIENLEFDSVYGFPSYIYFDISEVIADDEISYTITNFIPTK